MRDQHIDAGANPVSYSSLCRAREQAVVQAKIDEVLEDLGDPDEEAVPDNLAIEVEKRLKDDPAITWDEAVREIAENEGGSANGVPEGSE